MLQLRSYNLILLYEMIIKQTQGTKITQNNTKHGPPLPDARVLLNGVTYLHCLRTLFINMHM